MDLRGIVRRVPLARAARDALARLQHRRARRALAASYYAERLAAIDRWLDESRERTNFTYDLTPLNLRHLAAFVAVVTGARPDEVARYLDELAQDRELAEHVRRTTAASAFAAEADPVARYGRRLGWYALARLTKPRLVVETGVDKGLGACVLASALRRNAAEGRPGRYVGTDRWREAGWLFTGPLAEVGEVRYGDSLETLERLEGEVDLFIADSDHAQDYERREYERIERKLGPRAVLLSDTAHHTAALLEHAARTGREFLFWREEPRDHWYPGAGIGAAWRR